MHRLSLPLVSPPPPLLSPLSLSIITQMGLEDEGRYPKKVAVLLAKRFMQHTRTDTYTPTFYEFIQL